MAEYDFKSKKVVGKKSKATMWWEHALLPAMIDLDILFKIQFNWKAIKEDFFDHMGEFKEREFFNQVTHKTFNEKAALRAIKPSNIDNFKPLYVTYKGEVDTYTLKPQSKSAQFFGYTLTIESKDPKKQYTKSEIEKIAGKYLLEFEKVMLNDTKYFKIVK